jgi:two-component system response regulator CpxR
MDVRYAPPALLALDDVVLEPAVRSARCGERLIPLTPIEFRILRVMVRSVGQIVARTVLCRRALGRSVQSSGRSLDTHVCNLRKKLGPTPDGAARIQAVQGAGYIYRSRCFSYTETIPAHNHDRLSQRESPAPF